MARTYKARRTLDSRRAYLGGRPEATDETVTGRHILAALAEARRQIHERNRPARAVQG